MSILPHSTLPIVARDGRPAAVDDGASLDEKRSMSSESQAHGMTLLSSTEGQNAPGYGDLFFDLLFAACLNTYSNAVSLEKFANIAAFLGYFSALWWAWWSQVYFDVRYRSSARERPFLLKAAQLSVRMAVLGLWVAFSSTPSEFARGSFTNFALVYGCSRMALALDHAVVLVGRLVQWRRGRTAIWTATDDGASSSPETVGVICRAHLLAIATLVTSGLLWILSRFVAHHGEVTAPLLVMWLVGGAVEAAGQLIAEWSGTLSHLGQTVLPERLVLFGLIILGEGFVGIAETLNRMSPGSKVINAILGDVSLDSGGWGGDTILQTVSCVLIVVLQFGGYFHRATHHVDARSVLIVVWSYFHIFLHASSALLVIGLKKVLAFQNTLNAMGRFFSDPTIYLPDTPEWQNITSDDAMIPFDDGNGTSPLTANGTLAGISAIISVIQSNDGAVIPTLPEAQHLIASVVGLVGGLEDSLDLAAEAAGDDTISSQFNPSLVLPFKSYFEFADNAVNPDSIDEYVNKSLFQFKYIYVASAIYLVVDILIKTVQNGKTRKLRSFRLAMGLRFLFALVLVGIQVVWTAYDGIPTSAALDGALAICAGVLLAELLSQQLVDAFTKRLDRPRR